MRNIIFLLLLTVATQMGYAQKETKKERTVALWGHTVDCYTHAGIPGVKVTLMTPDSTVIDTMEVTFSTPYRSTKPDAYYKFIVPARKARYIIRASHPGYEDSYVDYEIKHIARNTYFDAPWHYMLKRMSSDLGEFVTTATKIRFYNDGDTLVYNADAFNLPQGSMLDALIAQLPGAKLNAAGEITVDGRKIENLTLNGKDFFKGQNRVMLDNLPTYAVKNVKVYEKSTETSEFLGREVEEKVYTMDVLLKKEYLKGIIANAELAGGTEERYLARLFGLRYTDNSRMALWGNVNNINETRRPAQNGNWAADNMPERETTTRKAGFDLLIDDKDKRWSESANVTVQFNESETERATAGERFMPLGSIHSLGFNRNRMTKGLYIFANNDFTLKKPFLLKNSLSLHYVSSDYDIMNAGATFSSSPNSYGSVQAVLDTLFMQTSDIGLQRIAINRNRTTGTNGNGHFYGNYYLKATHKLANGDDIILSFDGHYVKADGDALNTRELYYYSDARSENRNERTVEEDKQLKGYFKFDYNIHWLNSWNVAIYYNLDAERRDVDTRFYHSVLEDEALSAMTSSALSSIPTTLDEANSYAYSTTAYLHRAGINPWYSRSWGKNRLTFYLGLPLSLREERIDFAGAGTAAGFTLRKFLFNPSVSLSYGVDNSKKLYRLNYDMKQTMPTLLQMVDYTTNSNPLYVNRGNPNLGVSTLHKLVLQYNRRYDKRQARFNIWSTINIHRNMKARHTSYDPESGRYTYRPTDVNGNWHCDIGYNLYTTIDKKERFSLFTEASFDYDHNVDLALLEGSNESARSIVRNYQATEEVKFEYSADGITASLGAKVIWRSANSRRSGFETINIFDHRYAATLVYPLPYKFTLATDLNLYARNGSATESMDKADLVWNASLSRPLGKRCSMRLQAFDILHNLSGKNVVINGQGRTETFENVLPSYVMLHLQYNFNYTPKKKR